MKCKTKKKQLLFEQKPIISTILLMLFLIAFMFLNNYPSLQPIRDCWIYILINKTMISGVVLYFAWLSNKKPPLFERIIISAIALLPWVTLLIRSYRIIMLLQVVIFYILFVLFVKHFLTDKKYNMVTNTLTLILGMIFILEIKYYTYLNDSRSIHFWQIALIVAVVITFIFTVFLITDKIQLKDNRKSEKIIAPILVLGLLFILVAFTVNNLNYALDFSKPVGYATTILEKRIDTGHKKSTDYVITANVNGEEKEFNVDQSEYFRKQVGESFSVLLYSGTFGHEYYVYDYNR